jgi:hypothetical protein
MNRQIDNEGNHFSFASDPATGESVTASSTSASSDILRITVVIPHLPLRLRHSSIHQFKPLYLTNHVARSVQPTTVAINLPDFGAGRG